VTLVEDALESALLLPTAPQLWQRVVQLGLALDAEARKGLADRIAASPCSMADAEWLRCSALANLTRDPVWMVRQARLAQPATTPDAIMTLLTLAWHDALVRTVDRKDFIQALQQVDIVRLQGLAASWIAGGAAPQVRNEGAITRVAIYTPHVSSSRQGGTSFMLNIMSMFAKLGVELHAFSGQETQVPAEASYRGADERIKPMPVERETLKLGVPGKFQLTIPNTDFSVRARFSQVLAAIDKFQPDLVVIVGFMTPLAYKLYAQYPCVGLSIHAVPPAVPVDAWLCPAQEDSAACWPSLPLAEPHPFPWRFWPTGRVEPVSRTKLGIAAEATVLVTAGYRLQSEVTPSWGGNMLALLEAHPSLHWLLIGVAGGKLVEALPVHPRIHLLEPQERLESWLAACDIYANPPRVGGGASVAMAMEQGLAVAAYADTDGGDKVRELAADSDEAYFGMLARWANDRDARRRTGETLRERYRSNLDMSSPEASASLLQACRNAVASFNLRIQHDHA